MLETRKQVDVSAKADLKMSPIVFRAAMGDQPDTNPATWNTLEASTDKLYWLTLDFDDSADEFVFFAGVIPAEYQGGNITVSITWCNSGTVANSCIWNGAFWAIGDGNALNSSGFAAVQAVTDADTTTAYAKRTAAISFTNSQADSIVAGGEFVLQISRDANNGSDNLSGDARLFMVTVTED